MAFEDIITCMVYGLEILCATSAVLCTFSVNIFLVRAICVMVDSMYMYFLRQYIHTTLYIASLPGCFKYKVHWIQLMVHPN